MSYHEGSKGLTGDYIVWPKAKLEEAVKNPNARESWHIKPIRVSNVAFDETKIVFPFRREYELRRSSILDPKSDFVMDTISSEAGEFGSRGAGSDPVEIAISPVDSADIDTMTVFPPDVVSRYPDILQFPETDNEVWGSAVSYTHLTLPTIYSV